MITVEINTAKFDATLRDFSQRLGIALPQVVKVEAKALMAEVIKWTPPFKAGKAKGSARDIGKEAVSHNIRRAIYPLVESEWRNPKIKDAISMEDETALAAILKNSRGRAANATFAGFNPSRHKDARDSRGRVNKPTRVFTFAADSHASYTKTMQSRVGMAKGSWAAAYEAAGGKTPAWMKKAASQASKGPSTFINNLADPVKPSMSITSTALGVRGNDKLKSQINFALNLRSKAMASKFKRMLSDPIKYKNLYEQYK